nr:reverse transcriptase domain-containing protein [Tanacetum cinerariifolium]
MVLRVKDDEYQGTQKGHRSRCSRSPRPNPSVFSRIKRDRSRSPRQKSKEKERGMFKRLGSRGRSVSACSDSYNQCSHKRYTEALSESKDSRGGHWKSKSKRMKSSGAEDDLSQPWVYEEIEPFTHRIRYFDFPKTRIPNHIKTYDGNLLNESIDSYDVLKKAFVENYLQQKKCIKDPVEIHNIKQRDGESTKDFVKRYKLESMDIKGAPECMRIFRFLHGITNPKLIKRLHDKIPKTVDEVMRVTTSFLRGKWQPRITSERSRFHHGNSKRVIRSKISRKEASGTKKGQKGSEDEETEGPMIIEAEIGGHCIHRMYVDGGSASEILSPSPYNGIIGRPGVKKLQKVSSTAHGMLKAPDGRRSNYSKE